MKTNTITKPFGEHLLKKQTYSTLLNKALMYVAALMIFSACSSTPKTTAKDRSTEKPTLNDYKIGEKWTWKWQRSVDGEIRAQGEDYQEVVKYKNALGFYYGRDTLAITTVLNEKPSETPRYDWPLKVGKKWKYEMEWKNNEGTTGKTSQDVEIVSYNEETVAAGKFMAYKIVYKGRITNSRGFDGKLEDIWWYAPALKTYIKHIQNDGEGIYINELIKYSTPN